MTMMTKVEQNRNKMKEIIVSAAKFLPETEIRNAEHFLDHNEIGIAFAELCGSIVEGNITISKELKAKLLTMYDDLEGDSEEFWAEIKLKEHLLNMKTQEAESQ